MAEEREPFLARWSRLKREQESKPAEVPAPVEDAAGAEAPALPPVEHLTGESDFKLFMHPKVQDSLRRVALKKLFADPRFNIPDLNEAYSGDWTGGEPITQELLAQLNQARMLLLSDEEKEALAQEEAAAEKAKQAETTQKEPEDEPGRQDT